MRFRCPNDVFGYCLSKPVPGKSKITFLGNGEQLVHLSCRLTPKTCGSYITNTELAKMEGVRDPTAPKRRNHDKT